MVKGNEYVNRENGETPFDSPVVQNRKDATNYMPDPSLLSNERLACGLTRIIFALGYYRHLKKLPAYVEQRWHEPVRLADIADSVGVSTSNLAPTFAYVGTIRLKLFKIGAVILKNTHRIRFLLASGCPDQELYCLVAYRLAPG